MIALLLSVGVALAQTTSLSAADKARLESLITAAASLEGERAEIEKKATDKIANGDWRGGQVRASAYLLRSERRAENEARARQELLLDLKSRLSSLDTKSAAQQFQALTGNCQLGECISILGRQNVALAQALVDVNQHVVIESAKKFRLQRKDLLAKEGSLSAAVDLQSRIWACQRSVAAWSGQSRMKTDQMGACFAAQAREAAKKFGVPLEIKLSKAKRDLPYDRNLTIVDEQADAMVAFILRHQDYSVTPYELFEKCLEFTRGEIGEAVNFCYGSLRLARMRPDVKRKLIDIRGDRAKGGDNAGDFYHFFGMIQMRLAYGRITKFAYENFPAVSKQPQDGDAVDRLEVRNDLYGIEVGAALSSHLGDETPSKDFCKMSVFSYSK